jgi:hypothetical protein
MLDYSGVIIRPFVTHPGAASIDVRWRPVWPGDQAPLVPWTLDCPVPAAVIAGVAHALRGALR